MALAANASGRMDGSVTHFYRRDDGEGKDCSLQYNQRRILLSQPKTPRWPRGFLSCAIIVHLSHCDNQETPRQHSGVLSFCRAYTGQGHYLPRGNGFSTIRVDKNSTIWEFDYMTHNADDSGFDQPSLGELISLREATELSGLSASYLRLLVGRGDIWGMKLGRN